MERVGSRGTLEGRWRRGMSARVSQSANGRAGQASVQKNKAKIQKIIYIYIPIEFGLQIFDGGI
ncbi:MAG TPA: hypothetical protein DCZ76_07930 [Treponema sp.]|nr:hypothetical protein [Treponema sp.]